MAFIRRSPKFLAIAASDRIHLAGKSEIQKLITLSIDEVDRSSTKNAKNDEEEEDDSNDERKATNGKSTKSDHSQSIQILAVEFSSTGDRLAVCTNRKRLIVWRWMIQENDGGQGRCWKLEKSWQLEKAATSIAFTNDEKSILIADRSGHVTEYSMDRTEAKVLLGHLSILLDLCLSIDGKFLLTADRDEKIRVSRYPRTYDIQAFCLGHTEYVRTICLIRSTTPQYRDLLASGGGDGLLKLWRFIDGVQAAEFDLNTKTEGLAAVDSKIDPPRRIRKILQIPNHEAERSIRLAVIFEESPSIDFLEISINDQNEFVLDNTIEWRSDRSDVSRVIDICPNDDSHLYAILKSESESYQIVEIDGSQSISQSIESSDLIAVNRSEELKGDFSKCKEELPPMLKCVQFDNVGDYLERKKARIDAKSK